MKRILLFLFIVMLIGKIPIGEWEKIPQGEFIYSLGMALHTELECKKGEIIVERAGDDILFFWECLDPKPDSKSKTKIGF